MATPEYKRGAILAKRKALQNSRPFRRPVPLTVEQERERRKKRISRARRRAAKFNK